MLTLGGLVVIGTIIPDWQWFDEVEHAARAGFTVHTGGSIDDEHGGWARLFRGVSDSMARDREEHRAAQNAVEGLSERYRRALGQEDHTKYIHLRDARVLALGANRAARCRDALAGTAVGDLGMVLRASGGPTAAHAGGRHRLVRLAG